MHNPLFEGARRGSFGGYRVIVDPHHPREFSHFETVRIEAHPLVKWLARWLPIKPYVEAEFARDKDCDPLFNKLTGTLHVSAAQFAELQRMSQ